MRSGPPYEEYKDRIGETLWNRKTAESYSITVDLGRAEAVIRREEMIPRENLRQGDRVRAHYHAKNHVALKFFCHAYNNLWLSCSPKKCEIYDCGNQGCRP